MLEKKTKYHIRVLLTTAAQGYNGLQDVNFKVNFALKICILECTGVLATKF